MFALTAFASEYHIEECRQAGFDDYFVKPFKLDVILKALEAAFARTQRWDSIDPVE